MDYIDCLKEVMVHHYHVLFHFFFLFISFLFFNWCWLWSSVFYIKLMSAARWWGGNEVLAHMFLSTPRLICFSQLMMIGWSRTAAIAKSPFNAFILHLSSINTAGSSFWISSNWVKCGKTLENNNMNIFFFFFFFNNHGTTCVSNVFLGCSSRSPYYILLNWKK